MAIRYVGGFLLTSEEHCRMANALDRDAKESRGRQRRTLQRRAQVQATLAVAQAIRESQDVPSSTEEAGDQR